MIRFGHMREPCCREWRVAALAEERAEVGPTSPPLFFPPSSFFSLFFSLSFDFSLVLSLFFRRVSVPLMFQMGSHMSFPPTSGPGHFWTFGFFRDAIEGFSALTVLCGAWPNAEMIDP